MGTIFSSNIKFLRNRKKRTQQEAAFSLNIKRSTLSGYENSVAQPSLSMLAAFSKYYGIAIDTLIKVDLSILTQHQLYLLENGEDVFITGSKIRVLATTTDNNNNENIELVPEKAKAGYTAGFADPNFISTLPTFQLPFLSKQKKYRTFQISGDSMLPIPDGAFVTGEFVQNWHHLQNKHAYIILTLDDGIVFKVVENNIKENGTLMLYSLNDFYKPYEISVNSIKEVWKFVNYISKNIPEPEPQEAITESIKYIKQDITEIKNQLKSKE